MVLAQVKIDRCLRVDTRSDTARQSYANTHQLTTISVGYRLAPEHNYPAVHHDCIDVADYLVDYADQDHGVRLLFMGGESVGATLSAAVALHL